MDATQGENGKAAPISLREAFLYWLKLGCISFGGPAGQIAIMHQDLVERRRWISERRFLHALNYCMLLPGPEAQQLATYLGWMMHRTWGGILAGTLFVLPSLLLLILLSWLYVAWGNLPLLAGLFYGIKPAVTAIVLQATLRIGGRVLRNRWLWAIAGAAFIGIFTFNLPFPVIVAAAALAGFAGGRLAPGSFSLAAGGAAQSARSYGPAWIDDDTPSPAHARWRWLGLLRVISIGVLLWLLPMLYLMMNYGWQHPFTQMGWFFSKAALLTFGGAYAVLPYVYQGAVVHYAWLTPPQMIDGLALGETTPGPLIMVVAFVGFVGSYAQVDLGAGHAGLAGVFGALLVTWFTFLPSFIFVLAGGPLVESTRGDFKFTAPLTAVTAAIAGVILNLAVFFAWHVLWPHGFAQGFDGISAVLGVAAAVALLRFKRNVIEVIAVCALLGWVLKTLL